MDLLHAAISGHSGDRHDSGLISEKNADCWPIPVTPKYLTYAGVVSQTLGWAGLETLPQYRRARA